MADTFTLIRIADCETTALEAPNELCEYGYTDIRLYPTGWQIESGPHAGFVNPGMPVEPGARAAHHITDEELATGIAPDEARRILMAGKPDYVCFHNARFDVELVKPNVPVICTLKVAKELYPESKSHKNGALWYELGLGGGAPQMQPVHRAGPDSWTTAHLLMHMLRIYEPATMAQISQAPIKLLKINFGKHKGMTFRELPLDYLEFIAFKSDMRTDPNKEDVVYTAECEIRRRASAAPARTEQPIEDDPDAWRRQIEQQQAVADKRPF